MAFDRDLETAKLLFDAVKVMIPVLTAFLTFYATGVGKAWEKTSRDFGWPDGLWIGVICLLAVLSLGCWALTLAGAIISTSGSGGVTLPISNADALIVARVSMGVGYWLFLGVLANAGIYYFYLIRKERESKCGENSQEA
jgi:hypothetical protein